MPKARPPKDLDPLQCRPPYAHISLGGSLRCQCGAEDFTILLELMLAPDAPPILEVSVA